MTGSEPLGEVAERARRWRDATYLAVCDVMEPWEHGMIARATRYPSYYDFNLVRVEDDPGMGVDALIAVSDEALAGLEHRRLDFDLADAALPLRADFDERGWQTAHLVWMRHQAPLPPGPDVTVEEVPYDTVRELRQIWHREDFPTLELGSYETEAKEVALAAGARVFALIEDGRAIGFAEFEGDHQTVEITQVFVHPDSRGAGRGTALTRKAVQIAADARDIWIIADVDDRPKELYHRLGFRPAWRMMEFTRFPGSNTEE